MNNAYAVYTELTNKISETNRKESVYSFIKRTLMLLSLYLFSFFSFIVAGVFINFPSQVRSAVLFSFIISFIIFSAHSLYSYLRSLGFFGNFDFVNYSAKIGSHYPDIADNLSNALSVYKEAVKKNLYYSSELAEENLIRFGKKISGRNISDFIQYRNLSKLFYLFLTVLTVILLSFAFFYQPLYGSLYRIMNYNFQFINNGNGFSLDKQALENEYPVIKHFRVTVSYPEYTGLPDRSLKDNEGDVFCPEGSRISFGLKSNKELKEAGIEYNGGKFSFSVTGDSAYGTITPDITANYKFYIKDVNGKELQFSKEYILKIMQDEPPAVEIIQPAEDEYTLSGEKEIMLRARITDDYGFSKLILAFRNLGVNASASGNFAVVAVPIRNLDATALEVPYIWDLSSFKSLQGSYIEYYMEVTDNTGKTAKSKIKKLVYKSFTELLKNSEKTTKDIKANLKSVMDDFEKLQQDLKEISRNTEELGVNESRKNDLQQKIENVQKSLDAVQQKIEQGINEMRQTNTLSDKTLEQFMKLQELFSKINTPEFREMLRKLQEALKKNNLSDLKQELNNMRFDEEAFRKQLEQVMELMKKIENLQKFGELTQKLDEITKKQEELKSLTENTKTEEIGKQNSLANKQQDIKDETKKFSDDLKDLINNMNKTKDEVSTSDLQNLQKKMQQKNTEQKMQKSTDELFKGKKEESEKTQEEILEDLKEMNEDMQSALESAMDSQDMNKKMMDKIKEIKKNLEELSEDQKVLQEDTKDAKDENDFNKYEKEQAGLQQRLSKEIEDLMNLSKNGFEITPDIGKELGNAYNSMDKAGSSLRQSDKSNSLSNQGKAKQSLDNAAKMLSDMLDQMSKMQGKGKKPGQGRMGELMQRLAQLIGQQQGVNSQMNKMGKEGKTGKDGKGGKEELSQEQIEKLERLKLEQESIRKSLEELNAEFEKERQRSGERLLGDLDEIQKEMKEVVKQMEERNLDDKLIEKQERILSRMLDAQLSQREKDFEQKRESKPGENYKRLSPPEIILSGPRSTEALKEDFLRVQKYGLPEEFEAVILEYLKLLRQNGLQN